MHSDLHSYDEIEIIKGFKRNIPDQYIIFKIKVHFYVLIKVQRG